MLEADRAVTIDPRAQPLVDTIVCTPLTEWSGLPHNSKHLMKEAARRGYRVLWVDPIGIRRATLQRRDLARLARRFRHALRPLTYVAERTWRLAPVAIPLQSSAVVSAWNTRILAWQIRAAMWRLGAGRALLWSYSPQLLRLRTIVEFDLAIYHRTDDYPALPGMNAAVLEAAEANAVAFSDLCIAPARRYFSDALAGARRAAWVPNAIDPELFSAEGLVDPLPAVPRPRILMAGTFDEWVDIGLLDDVARSRPDWSVVLAGERRIALDPLTSRPNVHFVGRLPYQQMPALIAHCDIGLVPFRLGRVASDATPGKIYQYLAGGLPVLCTPFLDGDVFGGHVATAQSDAFVSAMSDLIRADSPKLRARRRAFAFTQTWSARFDAVEAELRVCL
jgi:glycosyltransferase involved in cell wall biosynthesis